MLFKIIYGIIRKNSELLNLLGDPVYVEYIDISDLDFSGINLANATFKGCIALGANFRKSNLRNAKFINCVFEQVAFDEAIMSGCDFTESEVSSLYVFDAYNKRTSAILHGDDARQWLFTSGAIVSDSQSLNPLIGQPWYEAAREVTRTIVRRIAGTHQDISLAKGTKSNQRDFANTFVTYLKKKEILIAVGKSKKGPGDIVKLNVDYRDDIVKYSENGVISENLAPFFIKLLPDEFQGKEMKYFKRGDGTNQ